MMRLGRSAGVVLQGAAMAIAIACGDPSNNDEPTAKWSCVAFSDGCTCSQLRPGKDPKPGVTYVDRCPAAPCCLLNTQSDESSLANCGCLAVADDCEARATETQTKVVATCPPP
jgi:hypothetical protein